MTDDRALTLRSRDIVMECRRLFAGYEDKTVVHDIGLSFEKGSLVFLLGPNGSGKTTFLRTISGHLKPLLGEINLLGKPFDSYSSQDLSRIVAVVLTEKILPPLFLVSEFVALGRYPYTDLLGRLKERDKKIVLDALCLVRACHLAKRPLSQLSDGELQKVFIARALAQEPKILILDEPTSHLDVRHRIEIMRILKSLCKKQDLTVVASSHDVDLASKLADKVVLIKNGIVACSGKPEDVLNEESIRNLYDLSEVTYNPHLGVIELQSGGEMGRVFVIAGMASGGCLFRSLNKAGFSIVAGFIHENDLDAFVARSTGAFCLTCPPSVAIDEEVACIAFEHMDKCFAVVDAGFEINSLNKGNLRILQEALARDKPVITLRNGSFQVNNGKLIRCNSVNEIVEILRSLSKELRYETL